MPQTKQRSMSPEHKEALATGRSQSRAVKAYLEALKTNKPKRGRKRSPEAIRSRLAKIEKELSSADPLQEVLMLQEQENLSRELEGHTGSVDLSGLEGEFIRVAAAYSESKGIDYGTWRKVGVSTQTLSRAGIRR